MKKITRTLGEYTYEWYTQSELLDLFPDAIPNEIEKCKKRIVELESKISEALNYLITCNADKFSIWYCKKIIQMMLVKELLKQDRYLSLLNSKLNARNPNYDNQHELDYQQRKERAKNYPIAEIANRFIELKQNGNKFVGCCPIHNEKTPSFYLYIETNTYHCFGCGAHGDVINLTMNLYGTDFRGALEILQN